MKDYGPLHLDACLILKCPAWLVPDHKVVAELFCNSNGILQARWWDHSPALVKSVQVQSPLPSGAPLRGPLVLWPIRLRLVVSLDKADAQSQLYFLPLQIYPLKITANVT